MKRRIFRNGSVNANYQPKSPSLYNPVFQMFLDMEKFLLNVEAYQSSKCCWTWRNFVWTHGSLSVLQTLLDTMEFCLNMVAYQFSKCCWTRWKSDWTWSLPVSQILLDIGEFWLNMEVYQFSKCYWTLWNSDWTWKPISSPNVAGHGGILTEHESLSVLQISLKSAEYFCPLGSIYWRW